MKRNQNVELFRCILMFLIVAHHCFVYGIFSNAHAIWTALFTTLICWHVDSFVSITGWFGLKFSWKKVIALYGQILFYSIINFFYCGKIDVTGGWFGGTYLALLFVSPLINASIEQLKTLHRQLFTVWGLFAAVIILSWLPMHLFTGMAPEGVDGHSLVLFVFIYFTMRVLKNTCEVPLAKKCLLHGPIIFVGMLVMFGLINYLFKHPEGIGRVFASYDGPHVWIMAFSMLLLFVWYVKIPSSMERIVAFCSPSMFGIYLFHDTTKIGRDIIGWLEHSISGGGLHPVCVIIITTLLIYLVSLCIDFVRRFIVYEVKMLWERKHR